MFLCAGNKGDQGKTRSLILINRKPLKMHHLRRQSLLPDGAFFWLNFASSLLEKTVEATIFFYNRLDFSV